jgi:hypothetical protein
MNFFKRKRPIIAALTVALSTALLAVDLQAASISFGVSGSPTTSVNIMVGNSVTIDVFADFSAEATLGGSFDIVTSDALLTYQNTSFATVTTLQDPDLNRAPDVKNNKLEGFAFGGIDGVGTYGVVGSMTFTADSIGTFIVSAANSDCSSCGGDFISDQTFSSMAVAFDSIAVTVTGAAVMGCVYPSAFNYDSNATIDNGSCVFAKEVSMMGGIGLSILFSCLGLVGLSLKAKRVSIV